MGFLTHSLVSGKQRFVQCPTEIILHKGRDKPGSIMTIRREPVTVTSIYLSEVYRRVCFETKGKD